MVLSNYKIVVEIPVIEKNCRVRFVLDNFGFIKHWYNIAIYRDGSEVIFLVDGFRFVVCDFDDVESAVEAYEYLSSLDVIELWNVIYGWLNTFLAVVEENVKTFMDNIRLLARAMGELRKSFYGCYEDIR